jgi:MFS transporter, DHA3 family, macrolide efflux protein
VRRQKVWRAILGNADLGSGTEKKMARRSSASGMGIFLIIWFGQFVSLVGSGLSGFALGIWVYQRTGSVTQFALISVFAVLPGIVISPLAGAVVDRWDRRRIMIVSDIGAGFSSAVIVILLFAGRLEPWCIYLVTAANATCNAFQWPAFSAMTALLVPKQSLGRAGGLAQFGEAAAQIIAPALAGVLVGTIRVQGVLLIDFVSLVVALCTLVIVRVPKPAVTAEGNAGKGSLLRESAYGWTYIRTRPGLLGLTGFFAFTTFTEAIVLILITPLVLSFAPPTALGTVLSIGGIGMLSGGLVMSVWGGPKRRVYGILGSRLLQGMVFFLGGLQPSVSLITAAAFVFLFADAILLGSSQAILQSKVALDVQGRVFAARRMIAWSSMPCAYLIAGPLADHIFEPLLAVNGPLAAGIGSIIGVGPGRGIGLLFIVMGILTLLATVGAYLYPRLRLLEDELPDAIAAAECGDQEARVMPVSV